MKPKPVFSEDEQLLVYWITAAPKKYFLRGCYIFNCQYSVSNAKQRKTPFNVNMHRGGCFGPFLHHHPELSNCTNKNITSSSATVGEEGIIKW